MGYLGEAEHPEVIAAVKDCIKRIVKAGKLAGFLTGSKELVQVYKDAGSLLIGESVDTLLLSKVTRELATSYKPELAGKDSNTAY